MKLNLLRGRFFPLSRPKLQEFAVENNNTIEGQKITFDRAKYNTTIMRSAGVDCNFGTSDDIFTTYQFDNIGRTYTASNTAYISTIATNYNPLRYRGYVYDTDTGFYYLQSRYYDPTTCRFINADGYISTGQGITGNNMFVYCGNNPVCRADYNGLWWHVLIGAAISGTVSLVSSAIDEFTEKDGKFEWEDIAIANVIGSIEGACVAMCPSFSPLISAGAGSTETFLDEATGIWFRGSETSWDTVTVKTTISGGIGALSGATGSPKFVKDGIIDEAVDGITAYTTNSIRKEMIKIRNRTTKTVVKELVSNQLEDFAYKGIEEYTTNYTEFWLERHFAK